MPKRTCIKMEKTESSNWPILLFCTLEYSHLQYKVVRPSIFNLSQYDKLVTDLTNLVALVWMFSISL